MEKKIRSELHRMTAIMVVLLGLGVYAHEFVIAGIQAKAALNLSIFATFGLAAWLAFSHVMKLKNEVLALNALKVDYGTRARRPLDPYKQPAIVFHEPDLLGNGYRMISEELGKQDSLHLSNATVQMLLHDVDQRINDRKSTIMYFSGLMVFLGLLGAFMGLMKTVHSVGDLIGSMDVSGAGGADSFGKLIEGMKGPLNGMSVGFSSSLFGLMTSMVLGALERFMTSAMKALRNEYEHWLSNIAELEGGNEQAHAGKAELAEVTAALAAGSRQLTQVHDLLRGGAAANQATGRTLETLANEVASLARHVARIGDPAPAFQPAAEAVAELARNQHAIVARMEALLRDAEYDRAALGRLAEAIGAQSHRHPPVDAAALHAQVDRLIALQTELAERPPASAATPSAVPLVAATGMRGWLRTRFSGSNRDASLAPHVRKLAAQQERLSQDVRATFDHTVEWIATQREVDREMLRKLSEDQAVVDGRLARLLAHVEDPDEGPQGARAGLDALSRAFGGITESGNDRIDPPADAGERAA